MVCQKKIERKFARRIDCATMYLLRLVDGAKAPPTTRGTPAAPTSEHIMAIYAVNTRGNAVEISAACAAHLLSLGAVEVDCQVPVMVGGWWYEGNGRGLAFSKEREVVYDGGSWDPRPWGADEVAVLDCTAWGLRDLPEWKEKSPSIAYLVRPVPEALIW
jgi:hypothetical protein